MQIDSPPTVRSPVSTTRVGGDPIRIVPGGITYPLRYDCLPLQALAQQPPSPVHGAPNAMSLHEHHDLPALRGIED